MIKWCLLGLVLVLVGCDRDPGAGDVASNNHGVGLMGMFKYDDAYAVFDELVRKYPDWVEVKVNLAILPSRSGPGVSYEFFLDLVRSLFRDEETQPSQLQPSHHRQEFIPV